MSIEQSFRSHNDHLETMIFNVCEILNVGAGTKYKGRNFAFVGEKPATTHTIAAPDLSYHTFPQSVKGLN